MQFSIKLNYKTLYWIWGVLFALTALLGLAFPDAENSAGRLVLQLISAVFFLPPWLILAKANGEGNLHHVRIVRYLSIASLAATLILFCAGIFSVRLGQSAGDILHILMAVICAPLVCSDLYVLPMFLWATLLVGSFGRRK